MTESSQAVFLRDASAAERICVALRASGIDVWFDQCELRGGDAWDAAIRKQIKACPLFIPVISANAHARVEGYFRLEWKLEVDLLIKRGASARAFQVAEVYAWRGENGRAFEWLERAYRQHDAGLTFVTFDRILAQPAQRPALSGTASGAPAFAVTQPPARCRHVDPGLPAVFRPRLRPAPERCSWVM